MRMEQSSSSGSVNPKSFRYSSFPLSGLPGKIIYNIFLVFTSSPFVISLVDLAFTDLVCVEYEI